MICKNVTCRWNHEQVCLHGATEAQAESARRQLAEIGVCFYVADVEIDADGQCVYAEDRGLKETKGAER